MIIIPTQPDIRQSEQSINNILMLKTFVLSIRPLYEVLAGARSDLLLMIRENCRPENVSPTVELISGVINDDVTYQKTPLDLRNQRTYAVKVVSTTRNSMGGVNYVPSPVLVAFLMSPDRLSKKLPMTYINMLLISIVSLMSRSVQY